MVKKRGALGDKGTTQEHRTQVNSGRNSKPAGGLARAMDKKRGALRDQGTTQEHRTQVNSGRNTKLAGGLIMRPPPLTPPPEMGRGKNLKEVSRPEATHGMFGGLVQ